MTKQPATKKEVVVNGRVYKFGLKRSKRAKNLILKIDPRGEAEVVLPWLVASNIADDFVRSRVVWLDKVRKKQRANLAQPDIKLVSGVYLPILGDVKRLVVVLKKDRQRSVYKEDGNVIRITVAENRAVRAVVERWYQARTKSYVTTKANRLASQLGVQINAVVMSNAKTQWGSCIKSKGRISLQWRLAQAPLGVLDYVIAHEVMHMKISGHTKAFWAGVETVCLDYQERRLWLKENGYRLYRL